MNNYNSKSYLLSKDLDLSKFEGFDLISVIRRSLDLNKNIAAKDLNEELFITSEYTAFCIHQRDIKITDNGSFLDFLHHMITKASYDPPSAIKYNFDKLRLKNSLKTEGNKTLYILSKGKFGKEKFICLTTSEKMYNSPEYLIIKEKQTH